ncbi:hypothetical protein B0H11DRAFT_2219345 [Mycena galericulata]|nr:hypothetical protein B0H11DRAFT_2219345 [Mycena galericulata]
MRSELDEAHRSGKVKKSVHFVLHRPPGRICTNGYRAARAPYSGQDSAGAKLRRATLTFTFVLLTHTRTRAYSELMDAFASIISYFVAEVEDLPELPPVDEDKSSGSSGSCVVA